MIWIEINVHIFPMETGICSMEFRISQISEPPAIRYRNYAKVSPDTVDTDLEDGEMTPMYRKPEQLSGGGSPIRIQRKEYLPSYPSVVNPVENHLKNQSCGD
jgi:hypothetical protein